MIKRTAFFSFLTVLIPLQLQAAEPPRVTVGQTFLADSLDPADGNAGWALTSHGVGGNLFVIDKSGRIVGRLAENIQGPRADGSWIVTLKPGQKFSDGSAITAQAVATSLARTNEKNAAARATVGKMSFEAQDERRFVIKSERPTPVMASVLAEWAFAVYKGESTATSLTGPYRVESLRRGDSLSLVPNASEPGASERGPVTIKKFADAQTMALAFEAGELDMAFGLAPETVARVKAKPGISVKSFLVGYQYMMWQNTRRETLSDVRVRRAIDLATDRWELVTAVNGGKAATGAFATTYPFSLLNVRSFDSDAANKLLDEAGWKRGNDGVRAKDGKPLELTLVAYPQRPDLVTMQPVIRARLAAIGIQTRTRVVEQVAAVTASGDFDLLLWAQHTAPAGDPGFFLNAFRTGAGNNYAGLSSPEIDSMLDKLGALSDPEKRAILAGDIQRKIFELAPVSFLITPEWHVAVNQKLATYEPWGSDYYIIRSDLRAK